GFRGQILRRLGNRNAVFRRRTCRHLTRRGEGFLPNFFQLLLAILLGHQRVALRFYVVTAPLHLLVRVVVVDVGRSRRVVHAVVVLVPAVANVRLVVVRTVIVGPRRIVPPARIVLAIAVLGVRRRGAASHGQTAEHGYDHQ